MAHDKPEILYPTQWHYRIIGTTEEPIRNVIDSVMGGKNYNVALSNQSSGGKYLSFLLTTVVDSEEERVSIFESLKASDEIKMVL